MGFSTTSERNATVGRCVPLPGLVRYKSGGVSRYCGMARHIGEASLCTKVPDNAGSRNLLAENFYHETSTSVLLLQAHKEKSQNLLRHANYSLLNCDTMLHRTRGSNENYGGNNYDKETNIRFGTAMLLSRLQIQRHARIDLHLRWSPD